MPHEPRHALWARLLLARARMSSAIGVSERNGHARVVGRLLELMSDARSQLERDARTVLLSREDESMLRDVDERQLGHQGLTVAQQGTTDQWRNLVRDSFRLRYGLMVVFDATTTTVE
jgi:hypothetical protein